MGFKGNESIPFIKNSVDTVIFKCQDIERYYKEVESTETACFYNLLNEKATFRSSTEGGDLVFHYFISTPGKPNSDAFELTFKYKPFIRQISASDYDKIPFHSGLILRGVDYEYLRIFTSDGDSLYLNNSFNTKPEKSILRIRLDNEIYELIP
jgi:hypothetical protein